VSDYPGNLRDYQVRGVNYLTGQINRNAKGGFLWDEPGLGKTRQAIVAAKKLGGPVLVACPNSLKRMWRREIKEIFPNDKVVLSTVGGRFEKLGDEYSLVDLRDKFPFWVVTHYTGLRISTEEYKRIPWKVVVADECHYTKNRNAQRTEALWNVTPRLAYRIGLTATPFGKNPADLWAQLRWMAPACDALKSYWKFYNWFVDYEFVRRGNRKYREVKGGKNLDSLAKLMSGFGLQRTKKQVAPDLPPLISTPMPLEPDTDQQLMYNKLKGEAVEVLLGDEELVIANVLTRMVRMEQVMSHPWTYDDGVKGSKLRWLKDWADTYRHPAVVTTRFKPSAKRVAKELDCGTPITGDVPEKLRDGILKRWLNGEEQFLVGTIATIGTGLNLTPAHSMVCYDQVYNPIYMDQVRQRIHRITTDHPVQVIYLYNEDTTNEVVYDAFMNRLTQMETVKRFMQHLQED
jgi:SNF2 family DNA or RNA helicase